MRCYQRGFGPIEEGALFCLAPQEAARLCTHPQNHFVCSTRFGMLEPVPYATPTCPDPFDDGGPPARPEAGLDATVPPGMDASRPDVTRPEPDASRLDVSRPDVSRPDATAMDVPSVDAARPDAARPDGSASDAASDAGRPDVEPSADAAVCAVSEVSPDCDTLAPCSAATFMAACDDGERLRYCEAAAGSPTATVRIRFCVGADVCRACRGGECAPGFESVCAPR
jgi:hypothetical protein